MKSNVWMAIIMKYINDIMDICSMIMINLSVEMKKWRNVDIEYYIGWKSDDMNEKVLMKIKKCQCSKVWTNI